MTIRRHGQARRTLVLAAGAASALLALAGCHADRNVSGALDCSRDREYQVPRSPACHPHRAGGGHNHVAAGAGSG